MSLKIFYAHTGECLLVDPQSFSSVDDLKLWIEEQINISPQNQILTTVKGLLVKLQALSTESEFFLYSRHYIVPSSNSSAPAFQIPALTEPQPPPDRLESQNDLGSWKTLFSHRVTWAKSVLAHADTLISSIRKTNSNISIMERSVDVAASNLNTHVRSAVGNFDEMKGWAYETLRMQEKLLINWEPSLGKLGRLKMHPEVAKIVAQTRGHDQPRDRRSGNAQQYMIETLLDLVNVKDVRTAGQTLSTLAVGFERQMTDLAGRVEEIRNITNDLEDAMSAGMKNAEDPNPEEPQYLLNDIAAVVQRIHQDYEHVGTLPNTPKSITSASKLAHNHTKDLLPQLVEMITDMSELRQRVVHRKNKVSQLCVQYLQKISRIEEQLYHDVKYAMEMSEAQYNEDSAAPCSLLALVVHLPSRYSLYMVESVRRREWSERMKSDGSKLAEELAGLKDEEEKRRKKWYKTTTQGGGLMLEFLPPESSTSGINVELSVQSDSSNWPAITRDDLGNLLEDLKAIEGMESTINDLAQQIIDLDKPSRRQRKAETPTLATRAFKMGSVHEAAMSNSGMFPQGDADDATRIKILQAERVKWDAQVRTYESRIRKLEDLLHRARSGNSTGIQFTQHGSSTTNTSQPPLSPATAEPLSRNSSQNGPGITIAGVSMPGAKRRISQVENIEKLALRIQTLEAELLAERENSVKLQEEVAKHETTEKEWSDRFADADQTKRDLLANMESQQQEFSSERKGYQEKFRDLEDQLESWKRRVEEVYVEIDKIEEARTEELVKKQDLENDLSNAKAEAEKYKDMAFDHEEELAKAKEEFELQAKEAADSAAKLESELSDLRAAAEKHDNLVAELRAEISEIEKINQSNKEAKEALEKKVASLEDALRSEQDRHGKSLEGHVDALAPLKASFEQMSKALGENKTAPASPKALVEGFENYISDLLNRYAKSQEKLATEEASAKSLNEKVKTLHERFETRTLKARDLTQRLYTHNARCGQLLENLGFTVMLRDGSTQIVRIPRTSSGEPAPDMNNSISMSSTLPTLPDNHRDSHQDLELLYWMNADDSEIESEKYATYLNSIGAFDVDAFCEAVRKRVKEAEHMARKWQKQARDYRDKYHRVQAEASEKIAFKSFKDGDLALFLPTRNQVTKPWAAFNVGAPHYFLREQDSHKLQARDWLLARISKIEERIVDLSKSTAGTHGTAGDRASINSSEGAASIDEENPFQLSDGLRWYLLDAAEEKPGAPTTPGLSSSTVASAHVDARGNLKSRKPVSGARKTLSKSLQQSGGPPRDAGEAASIRSRGSANSTARKDSSGAQAASPVPPATPLTESHPVVDP